MNNIKVVLNRENVKNQLLKSPEMQAICHELAENIVANMGGNLDDYEISDYMGVNRCNSTVITRTAAAFNDNLDNNTLLRSMK